MKVEGRNVFRAPEGDCLGEEVFERGCDVSDQDIAVRNDMGRLTGKCMKFPVQLLLRSPFFLSTNAVQELKDSLTP